MESLDRIADAINNFSSTFGGNSASSSKKGRHKKGRHGDGSVFQTPASAKRTTQNAWGTGKRLYKTGDNIGWFYFLLVVTWFALAWAVGDVGNNFFRQAVVILPFIGLLALIKGVGWPGVVGAFMFDGTANTAELAARFTGVQIVAGIVIAYMPVGGLTAHLPAIVTGVIGLLLLRLGRRNRTRQTRSNGFWIAMAIIASFIFVVFIAAMQVGNKIEEASVQQTPSPLAAPTETHVPTTVPNTQPPNTSGYTDTTSGTNASTTSTQVSTTSTDAVSTTSAAEAEMPEPSVSAAKQSSPNLVTGVVGTPYSNFEQGEDAKLLATISNNAGGDAHSIVLQIKLPEGVFFADDTQEKQWQLGDLASTGEPIQFEIPIKISDDAPRGSYHLGVAISADNYQARSVSSSFLVRNSA